MQSSRLTLGIGFIITVIGLAFLVAGPTNLATVPVQEVDEIGATVLIIGIILMLISGIVLRRKR